MTYYSERFARNVWFTHHATMALAKRRLDVAVVLRLIEHGSVIDKGAGHCWIHDVLAGRDDNAVCAAVVIDRAVVVKTVMINWQVKESEE